MKKAILIISLFLFASAGRAQQSESLYYYSQSGSHPLLHFPRIHYVGLDTFSLTGLAERFTSPFGATYLDSLYIVYSLPHFVDVPNNNYTIMVMGSTYDSTGVYLIADTTNILFTYRHHPSVSDTNHGVWLHIPVSHVAVDTAFFVVFALTDTNGADIEMGIGIDSVTFNAPQQLDDNVDRAREYGLQGQQFYVAGNHFTDLGSDVVYWYSNAMFVAYVSNGSSGVSQMTPTGFSVQSPYPNPASKSISLSYSLPVAEPVTIQLFDEAGRLMQSVMEYLQSQGTHSQTVDISMLPMGSYRYRVVAGSESLSGAFDTFH